MQYLSILKKHLLMFTAIVVCFNAVTSDGECRRPKKYTVFPIYQQTKNPNRMNRQNINNIDDERNRHQQPSDVRTLRTLDQIIDSGYTESNQQNENNNDMNTEEIQDLNISSSMKNSSQILNNKTVSVNDKYDKNYIPEGYIPEKIDSASQNTDKPDVISSNQYGAVPPPPPPPPAPPTIPTIPTVKTSNSEVEGMSLEEEFVQTKSGLRKVEQIEQTQQLSQEQKMKQEILARKTKLKKIENNNKSSNDNNQLHTEKNFLQNALTTAIKNKYKNINMEEEDDDDWYDNKEQQNYQNENLTNISDNIVNTKSKEQLIKEEIEKRYKNLHMHDDSLFDEDDDNDEW